MNKKARLVRADGGIGEKPEGVISGAWNLVPAQKQSQGLCFSFTILN
jgi:hypothetical protein